jgi:hypothetical protein
MRNVAAVAVRLATEIDEMIADVEAGTVYRVVSVVAAGFDCPNTLYIVGIYFSLLVVGYLLTIP